MYLLKIILIKIIRIYKIFISPFLGNNCRYLPTCSEYFIDSLNEHGVIKGTLKGIPKLILKGILKRTPKGIR